eukprot:5607949-Amphidinium_carterae.1
MNASSTDGIARPHTAPCHRPSATRLTADIDVLVKEMMSSAACRASSSTGEPLRPHTACAGLQAVVIDGGQQWDDSDESDGGEFDGPAPAKAVRPAAPAPCADVL